MTKKHILFAGLALWGCFILATPSSALDCKKSDCESLGYSRDDISGCTKYVKCPFDETYKACIQEDYSLTTCPENGICKVKLEACDNYYRKEGNSCVQDCPDGYELAKTSSGSIDCYKSACKVSSTTGAATYVTTINGGNKIIASCDTSSYSSSKDSNGCVICTKVEKKTTTSTPSTTSCWKNSCPTGAKCSQNMLSYLVTGCQSGYTPVSSGSCISCVKTSANISVGTPAANTGTKPATFPSDGRTQVTGIDAKLKL